jgi:LPS export ABC transporter protein LptC
MPNGFKLEFLDSNLNTTALLEANYGEILSEEKLMIARDSVILINFKDEELYTEELIWVQDSSRVYTDKYVKIVRNDVVIHGKGFESKDDFSHYVIKKITGQYYLDEETLKGRKDTIQ